MSDHVDKARAWDASRASWRKGYDRGLAEAVALCDAIANRPVQAPESGAWERAERHTAKRLAAEIRALVTIKANGGDHG